LRSFLGLAALGVLALPAATSAQASPRMVAGVVGGYTTTEHVWTPSAETRRVGGLLIGGFADVQTPLEWLTAGFELAYTQRGSDVFVDVGGQPSPGGIRADHLSFAIRVKAKVEIGPARLHLVAGPVSDFVIRSRLDPLLMQILDDESSAPFGVVAGVGLGFWVAEDLFVDFEARIVEGLQSSYSGDLIRARNRSLEVVGRVGMFVAQ